MKGHRFARNRKFQVANFRSEVTLYLFSPATEMLRSTMGSLQRIRLDIDGRRYTLSVLQRTSHPPEIPRLVIAAYQAEEQSHHLLRVCLTAIRKFTPEPHELWVVDRTTRREYRRWLLEQPGLNVVFLHDIPLMRSQRGLGFRLRMLTLDQRDREARVQGSYANAVQLEIAAALIDPQARRLMTLQMDTMPTAPYWLSFLLSKFDDQTGAVGVRLETHKGPPPFPHSLGCLVDWQLFLRYRLSFLPDLPRWDVLHKAIAELVDRGYRIWCCRNTYAEPELIKSLPAESPYRSLHVDRTLDDSGNVIFLHLGRGIEKSSSGQTPPGRTSPADWTRFAGRIFTADPLSP